MNLSELYKKRIQKLAGIENKFIYHGTNDGAAYYIQRSGKMRINAAGNNEPYISFTGDLNVAKYYADMKGGTSRGVVLRIIRTPDFFLSPKYKKNKGHEWVTEREIPLSELEIQTKEGWAPLEKWDIIDKKIIAEDDDRKLGKSLADKISSPFVVIFRAAPKDIFEFRNKDYITLSKKFAIEHAENNHVYHEEPFHVIQALVPTKNVYDAYNPGEYFFSGESKKAKEIYMSKGPDEYEGLDELNLMEPYKHKIRQIIRQVINESFEIDEMAYPSSFNFEEFKDLKSFTAKQNYAKQHLLGKVGTGTGRAVFKVDSEKVIKIALNDRGVEQNIVESEGYKQEYDVIAKVFDIDVDDYIWIEMELAKRISEKRFEEIVGVSLKMVVEYLRYQRGLPNYFNTDLIGTMDDSDFIDELWRFVQDYDYPVPGDFSRINSYGEVLRDGKPTVVVVDFGFSSDVSSIYKDYKKKKINKYQLAELDVTKFNDFSKEEYEKQLKHLKIDKFEDLVGRTVYFVKPVYGEHKVLKWVPEKGEYLLFTAGQRVWANPFNIIPIPEKIERETELKWVIEKLCAEEIPLSIEIKNISVNEKGNLLVSFDLITKDRMNDFYGKRKEVEVLYKDVILELSINERNNLSYFLKSEGEQKILKSSDGNMAGKWDSHAPFISSNYNTTQDDWSYMKKIVERIILDKI